MVIVGAKRRKGGRSEEVCVECRLGSFRFEVSLPSDEFTFVELKREIGRRLQCEFGTRLAKSLVGQAIPLAEIIKESDAARRDTKFWDLF
ncbi:MAG: hypothetical protein ABSF83_01865 [Nitrososphaerales archaeon]